MKTVIDAKKALDLLREAVAERGEDFEYRKVPGFSYCLYYHFETDQSPATPGCLVGLALAKAGVSLDELLDIDNGRNLNGCVGAGALWRGTFEDVEVTEEGAEIFLKAQNTQDDGKPWGAALRLAEYYAACAGLVEVETVAA